MEMPSYNSEYERIMSANERMRELNSQIAVDYTDSVALSAYFRVCRSMLNMAKDLENDGFKIKSYCLQKRFIILFIDHLSHRPDYKTCDPVVRNSWSRECKRVLQNVERMHKEILQEFEDEENARRRASAFVASAAAAASVPPEADLEHRLSSFARSSSADDYFSTSDTYPTVPSVQEPKPTPTMPPKVDRSLKPTYLVNQPKDLSPILVPTNLAARFLQIAEPNTRANKETCGTLCGRINPRNETLIVSHLIICKQVGTPDSCTTTNEEELLDCIENTGLIVMGWIHTHPSQTAFMSSMDLHCHLSYQLMLPEAIAIVCAPKHNDVQFFSLTPDYGVDFVRNCKEKGFHKHASLRDLYMPCKHVQFIDEPVQVCDLR